MAGIKIPARTITAYERDAMDGIEPPYQVLQTYAYPLSHMAVTNCCDFSCYLKYSNI